jgi:predicted AlkP superfamily pyrophosphatase or phosphodiesterase
MTGNPDRAPGEGGADGLDDSFPHPLAGLATASEAVTLTPSGTEIMLAAARAAIAGERLGQDDVTDFLALTFSGHDYAGHAWGQLSWERTDLLLRLDRSLAGFLDHLDAELGAGKWALVFTSDHGAARMVEQQRAAGKPAHRLGYAQLARIADAAAQKALGKPGPWAIAFASSTLYTSAAFQKLPDPEQAKGLTAMVAALRKVPGVGWAERTDTLLARCSGGTASDAERAACLSIAPDRSGDIFAQPAPDSLIAGDKYVTGTSHGSGNPDDTTVPLAILAPGLAPRRDPSPVSPLRVAPTLGKLLGIPAPPAAKDPPLF